MAFNNHENSRPSTKGIQSCSSKQEISVSLSQCKTRSRFKDQVPAHMLKLRLYEKIRVLGVHQKKALHRSIDATNCRLPK